MNGIQEVVPNVFQLEMPLPFPRLPVVNVYLIRDGDELGLVDCGMNIDGAFDTFSSYLKHLATSSSTSARSWSRTAIPTTSAFPDGFAKHRAAT